MWWEIAESIARFIGTMTVATLFMVGLTAIVVPIVNYANGEPTKRQKRRDDAIVARVAAIIKEQNNAHSA